MADEEIIELEVGEDDIYAYLVDEDDNEIGFVVLDENGEEQEYYYAEGEEGEGAEEGADEVPQPSKALDEYDLGITREGVADATADMNAVYKDGVAVVTELKGAFDDIASGFDFLKKK
ncbi:MULTISPECIES: hypothetical protein [unclassified Adlercreutzia]|uniref:hypothetical protein n=1 Tax=unclassified Adlercreutzia TaxID=2636013 RepID=UPI0013EB67A6|nr:MULTISPECIES: hypothetical protein [unclassified Adlercreutzia]